MSDFDNIVLSSRLRDYSGSIIVYTSTEDFVDILKLSLKSLNIRYKDHPPVLVFTSSKEHPKLSELSVKLNFELLYYDVDAEKCGPMMSHLPSSIDRKIFYTRLLLWSNFFYKFDNILFIDADTLVFNKFEELFERQNFMIEHDSYNALNDVVDVSDPVVMGMLKEDGIRLEKGANAGVFLLPKSCREPQLRESIFYLLSRYRDKLLWADQTLINLWMFKNNLSASSTKVYNYQTRTIIHASIFEAKKLKILHLNGVCGRKREWILVCLYLMLKARVPVIIILFFLKGILKVFRIDPDR